MTFRLDNQHQVGLRNTRFNNLGSDVQASKREIDKAYKDVIKAQAEFDKIDAKVDSLLNKKSSLLLGESVYRGLFSDYNNYGVHSVEPLAINDTELNELVQMIIKNDDNKELIAATNLKIDENIREGMIPAGTDFHVKKLSDAFLPGFATFPDKTKLSTATDATIANGENIARGIITTNTNLKSVIARESIFYVMFAKTHKQYEKKSGALSTSGTGDTLKTRLIDLQEAIERYNKLNSGFQIVVPGVLSATKGKMLYTHVVSELQIANANRENAVNAATANILLRDISQQVMQELKNVANSLEDNTTTANVNLKGIITEDSIKLIDKYRLIKGGSTISDKYGSLLPTLLGSGMKMTLPEINSHVKGLSTMIKMLADEGSRKMIEIQDITFKRNTVSEELSKLIRRIFSALDSAFGLPSN